MVMSSYTKQRVISLYHQGENITSIVDRLALEDGVKVSKQGVRNFLKRYAVNGTIDRKAGSGCPSKITPAIKCIIEDAMRRDDKTTATQIQSILASYGVYISLATITRARHQMGWIYRGSAYCQLIRDVNRQKRLEFAMAYLHDNFDDAIFSDETTVQLDTHRRCCYRKEGEKPRLKPRPKHPTKVHIWGGISKRGATAVCIFEGTMDAVLFCEILQKTLVPFLVTNYSPPSTHRFIQDNDPKHTSRMAQEFYSRQGINWWKTPPESPDMNPIENLWHELKEFLCREIKPTTKDQLVHGIHRFWATIDVAKCCRYIRHLKKVIPKVIEVQGNATGY